MFTGIIEYLGIVDDVEQLESSVRMTIESGYGDLQLGESIAVDGACLTVTHFEGTRFSVDISHETLKRTTLGNLRRGDKTHLERAMQASDRFGGHFVTGHVDALAILKEKKNVGEALELVFEVPHAYAAQIVPKGSVALGGVSLTVNDVRGLRFGVVIIPFTQMHTFLGGLTPGDSVNLETDILAKYVQNRA